VTKNRTQHKTIFKDVGMKTDAIALRPLGADFDIAVVTQTQDAFIHDAFCSSW
jgi:hypothetical protein